MHDEHGACGKDRCGKAFAHNTQDLGTPGSPIPFVEWDEVSTKQVLWLYKLLKTRGLL